MPLSTDCPGPRGRPPHIAAGAVMVYENFSTLRVEVDEGVAFVTIGHGELNLMDLAMLADLDRVGRQLEADRGCESRGAAKRESGLLRRPRRHQRDHPASRRSRPSARRSSAGCTPCWIVSARCRRRPSPRSRADAGAAAANSRSPATCGSPKSAGSPMPAGGRGRNHSGRRWVGSSPAARGARPGAGDHPRVR